MTKLVDHNGQPLNVRAHEVATRLLGPLRRQFQGKDPRPDFQKGAKGLDGSVRLLVSNWK